MSIEYLLPINESHAIQNVVFALEWQGELTSNALKDIHKLAPALKSHFPFSALQQMVKINIGAPLDSDSTLQQENGDHLGGVIFQRAGKLGTVVSQLNVSRSNCIIIISEYNRWGLTLEAVMRYFKIVLPVIMKEKSITNISLQYVDMFNWKDDPENINWREVFNENTPYLAPNIFDQKGLWHCHHGYLAQQFPKVEGRCLDNINVSIVDNQGDLGIQIHTTHQVTLNNPLRMATKDYLQSIEKVQNILHDHNKVILKQLLTNDVCKKIDL